MDNVNHVHIIPSNEGRVKDLETGQKQRIKGEKGGGVWQGETRPIRTPARHDTDRHSAEVGGPDHRSAAPGGATIDWVPQRCSCTCGHPPRNVVMDTAASETHQTVFNMGH
ncbi:hypothetical protein KIN20_018725 [Parelaphostrongylus tenuis]|uniref:Uncharacterized protein n=1 Tax=Parelaphostrongylus tenuis TaxID=148309 RepID=A0AAD5MNG1_PARTN|nr:hypothetical protein KIN20_018725 [Parelaphostrongylus tenuis]